MSTNKRIAIYPGTFDPITYGHMDIIRRAAPLVDTLIIGIAEDIPKTPIFSIDKRTAMVESDIASLPAHEHIQVKHFKGLLVDFAKEQGASILIRGLRAVSDFEYEFQMACMNSRLSKEVETIFLPASENTHFIASRFVKEIARLKGDISQLVSPHIAEELKQYYA